MSPARKYKSPSPEEMDRCNDVADAIIELLGVDSESGVVMTEPPRRISLTVDAAERLVARLNSAEALNASDSEAKSAYFTEAQALRALLAEAHTFPDYPGPPEGDFSTEEDHVAQVAWGASWDNLDDRIQVALGKKEQR